MAYQCNVCDKEFDHAGAKNLHERWCRLLQLEKEHGKKEVAKKEKMAHEHEWVLLGNSPVELVAKKNGYTKYCKECEVVE